MDPSVLSQLFEHGEDSNITIVCGGEKIKAHRIILRSGSDSNAAEVHIERDPETMRHLIKFMYSGTYPAEHENDIIMIVKMHSAAHFYQAGRLEDATEFRFSCAIHMPDISAE
ncbi:hypothetical protein IWZ03DRAFT_360594 [Phyllosticta citriasiana]|uniref:BTB domain-containing protein n=1 Tax=Phyllosticta citriasiana TaxID=595635 RepID=A0ABR1KKG7_9PEZI